MTAPARTLDAAILAELRRWDGQALPTDHLRAACLQHGLAAKTRTVRLHLFSLERRGAVRRLDTVQPLCWALSDPAASSPRSPSHPSRSSTHAAR